MSHATFPAPGASARIPAHGFGAVTRTLLIAAVLSAAGGLLATTLSDPGADITEAPRLAPAPSAVPAPAATGNTSVPDASAVFAGRDVEIEEPAPTF